MDEERAMYACENMILRNCRFDGPADGESAFKECKNIQVEHSFFNLRYPFWHDHGLTIRDSDIIVVMDQGRIVETGSHEELLAAKGRYYELYMTQYAGIAT